MDLFYAKIAKMARLSPECFFFFRTWYFNFVVFKDSVFSEKAARESRGDSNDLRLKWNYAETMCDYIVQL